MFSNISYSVNSLKYNKNINLKITSKIINEIEIPIGSDYYIKFSSESSKLIEEEIHSYSKGLSEKIINAIAKSPKWIQQSLTRQFQIIDGEKYADLIIEMDIKYVDEIAFCIAYSSIGKIPSVDILRDNVLFIYENDKYIKYADIIDYNDFYGNYYSTINYTIIEDGIIKNYEFPPEIYYWYVVHPGITGENIEYVYDEFWRSYLFNHNDIGYPLLKEKLSDIDYLWDCKSYFQLADRTWEWSINNHPTAIEVISYWIGKTVPASAFGDRPNQPNIISHEHNGWCGELQKIAIAAQRAVLIPTVAICNIGEDHAWREFYERGWHENDNWWEDTGGAVDEPDIYAYGWKKDMSAVVGWNGDDSIYDATSKYIKLEDTKIIKFNIFDRNFQPVDGVRVVVVVKGPRDITYIKYYLLTNLNKLWNLIPDVLKGKHLQFLYNKISDKIDEIPDSVDGFIYSIMNYTDIKGNCNFILGQNKSYFFIIQHQNLKNPLLPARFNKIRILEEPTDKSYIILFPFLKSNRDNYNNLEIPSGEILFDISFNSKSYQIQKNILGDMDSGIYEGEGKIDFFILDENNFVRYKEKKSYDCYNYVSSVSNNILINSQNKDWYFVFKNNCYTSNVTVNFSLSVSKDTDDDFVQIVTPNTNIFEYPIFNIGEIINISGISTNEVILTLNGESYNIDEQNSIWKYSWLTSAFKPGVYSIIVKCGYKQDEILIKLIDVFPPEIKINNPDAFEIVEKDILDISGYSSDNYFIDKIKVKIDSEDYKDVIGIGNWSISWNISFIDVGEHTITAMAIDKNGGISYDIKNFVINKTGQSWKPIINYFYLKPDSPTNLSNVIIYANVTSNSPFRVKKVVVYWDDGIIIKSKKMFRYADNPIQTRHEEDLLKNESNDPIFGLELGQFTSKTKITYWVEVYDLADNYIISNKKEIIIS